MECVGGGKKRMQYNKGLGGGGGGEGNTGDGS